MPLQVYDLAMEAALRGQNCGPRNLPIKGEWQWLLDQFAAAYGIRGSYTKLTYLRWILMYARQCIGCAEGCFCESEATPCHLHLLARASSVAGGQVLPYVCKQTAGL